MKKIVRLCIWLLSAVAVMPLVLIARIPSPGSADASFVFASQLLSLLPDVPGVWLRQAFYCISLRAPWPGPVVSFGTTLAQRDSSFGERVYVGASCNLGRCHIGSRTLIGSGVHVASAKAHEFEDATKPIDAQGGTIRKVLIGDDCWIGNSAVVLADLDDGVVVGAGSVVTKRCEKFGVYVGNPARLIKHRARQDG